MKNVISVVKVQHTVGGGKSTLNTNYELDVVSVLQ